MCEFYPTGYFLIFVADNLSIPRINYFLMKVLFICKYNAGRSRMAEALFNKLSKKHIATSAGIGANVRNPSNPKGLRATITVMKEIGITVPYKFGRAVTRKDVDEANKVIVLLDKKQRHILPKYITKSTKTEYYGIHDSDARCANFVDQQRTNRDIIRKFVIKMVRKIG
jgi:protein-tyrosine-phosphatase